METFARRAPGPGFRAATTRIASYTRTGSGFGFGFGFVAIRLLAGVRTAHSCTTFRCVLSVLERARDAVNA